MVISMSGTFTDQGVAGEQFAGKPVGMPPVITIQDNDRHVLSCTSPSRET